MKRIRPATYTLVIPQRATLEETITLEADGNPVDLTGYQVIAQIWKDEKRRTKIADLTVTFTDRVGGTFKLSLTRAETRAITSGGFWDMLVIEPGGEGDFWLEGPAEFDGGLSDDQ